MTSFAWQILGYSFFVILIGYNLYFWHTQGKLKADERLLYKEDGVRSNFAGIRSGISNIEITDKRIIEKNSMGTLLRSIVLPKVTGKFPPFGVGYAKTASIVQDKNGGTCLEVNCSGRFNILRYKIRYYLGDFSQIRILLKENGSGTEKKLENRQ